MKYIVAAGVSIVILALFVVVAVAARWTHGGGYLVQAALWSMVFVTWRSIVGNWDRIVASIQGRSETTHAPIFEAHVKATAIAGVLIIGIAAAIGIVRNRDQQKALGDTHPAAPIKVDDGSTPYNPSRIEWLELTLNAGNRVEFSEITPFTVSFIAKWPDTIVVYVSYYSDLTYQDRQMMEKYVAQARKQVGDLAQSFRWSSWLRIEESRKLLEKPISKWPLGDNFP